MSIELATYISDLVPTNPKSTDPKSQGDDHLRLIKQVIQNTFPNINSAITVTDEELNSLGGVALSGGWLFENDIVLDQNYTITSNKNAGNFGPVSIANGYTLTVPPGSTFSTV